MRSGVPMHALRFCRDGVLRFRDGVYNRAERKHYGFLIPVHAQEEACPGYLLSKLRAEVEFEPGLTVRDLFANLAPWSTEISIVASMRFDEFLEEALRPTSEHRYNELDRIEFSWSCMIDAVPKFDRLDLDDMFERIPGSRFYRLRESRPVVTDLLRLEFGWDHLAMYREPRRNGHWTDYGCSVDDSPLDRWNHLPVSIATTATLRDSTLGENHLSFRHGLFRRDNALVGAETTDKGVLRALQVAIEAPTPTLYDTVVKGFLWRVGWHGSPAGRDAFLRDLNARAEVCKEHEAEQRQGEEFTGEEFEAFDAAIEAAITEEEARCDAERKSKPFEDEDLEKLERIRAMLAAEPGSVVVEDGLPG